ncbi:MAG: replication-relaxation family protein [Deltaproteobacteria bacterium]|nr:replication-relaxation family protein [Deltaproteobacteria bacterium]
MASPLIGTVRLHSAHSLARTLRLGGWTPQIEQQILALDHFVRQESQTNLQDLIDLYHSARATPAEKTALLRTIADYLEGHEVALQAMMDRISLHGDPAVVRAYLAAQLGVSATKEITADGSTSHATAKPKDKPTLREKTVLELLKQEQRLTIRQVGDLWGFADQVCRRLFQSLKEKGLITIVGSQTRAGSGRIPAFYELTEKGEKALQPPEPRKEPNVADNFHVTPKQMKILRAIQASGELSSPEIESQTGLTIKPKILEQRGLLQSREALVNRQRAIYYQLTELAKRLLAHDPNEIPHSVQGNGIETKNKILQLLVERRAQYGIKISRMTGIPQATVAEALYDMEKKGLVTSGPHGRGRPRYFEITPQGKNWLRVSQGDF